MKKIVIIFVLMSLSLGVMAQGMWSQFGKITKGTPATTLVKGVDGKTLNWYVKPAVELIAVKFDFDKESKVFLPSAFQAVSIGGGIQHYTVKEEVLYNDYGANIMLLLNSSAISGKAGFGLAGTVNVLGFVGLGGGYDFTNKHAVILTGAQWNF
jgi:hypothetical protein